MRNVWIRKRKKVEISVEITKDQKEWKKRENTDRRIVWQYKIKKMWRRKGNTKGRQEKGGMKGGK